jgi:hypothetical protein
MIWSLEIDSGAREACLGTGIKSSHPRYKFVRGLSKIKNNLS